VDVVLLLAKFLHEVAELLHFDLSVVVEIKLLEGLLELLGAGLPHGLVLNKVLNELILSESPPVVLVECCFQSLKTFRSTEVVIAKLFKNYL
jgi:hypothetical protein